MNGKYRTGISWLHPELSQGFALISPHPSVFICKITELGKKTLKILQFLKLLFFSDERLTGP